MRVLVTGGAGFIGSHVVDHLIKLGHKVVVLDDLSGGFEENIHPKAIVVDGSITDERTVNDLFDSEKFDYVFHLAAYAAEGLSHFIRQYNYQNNLLGSVHLINASIKHKIQCFVFTSSIAVYGTGRTPLNESMPPMPEDPYGIAKYAVELDLAAAHKMFGLNYVIFRPHNVYGERQNIGDSYRNVIGIFMNQIMQRKPCTIFGDGLQTRAFTYISDVAPIIAEAPAIKRAYNEVFNIGADTVYTVYKLAIEVQVAMGKETGIEFLPAREEVLHAFSDHSKLYSVFDTWRPISLADGLQRMAAWAQRVGIRKGQPFQNIEIQENLPTSWRT